MPNQLELSLNNKNLGADLHSDESRDSKSGPLIFLNRIVEQSQKIPFNNAVQGLLEKSFERMERLAVILWHDKFDEIEAAMYLRLPDPYNTGAETIRYHALRTRKLAFHKVGKSGLIFSRADLDKALKLFKLESHRDL
jgi:hypothetical protein